MKKPLLTFAALAMLTVAGPGIGTAAPASGSTEEADRQFLAHLEASDAEQSHSTEAAPAPAPSTTTSRAHDSKPSQAKASTPAKKTAPVAKASAPIHRLPPGEVADDEVTPPAVASAPTITTVVTIRDRDEDHRFFHRLFNHLLSKHPEDW